MASTEWVIKGSEFNNCNCSYGCPCQFNALPTHGNCRSLTGIQIEEGYFGDIRLDGLRAVLLAVFPGAVHEGNGTMQLVIDERADAPAARRALEAPVGSRDRGDGHDLVGHRRDVPDQTRAVVQADHV